MANNKVRSFSSVYGVNASVEDKGIEVELANGALVWVRRHGNPEFTSLENRLTAKLRAKPSVRRGNIDPEDVRQHNIQLYSETVIAGWTNWFDNRDPVDLTKVLEKHDVREIPYSKKAAKFYLTEFPQFYDEVFVTANTFTLYSVEGVEVDAKN